MASTSRAPYRPVLLGRVSGVFAVQGWLRITSYTTPREHIADYKRWLVSLDGDGWRTFEVADTQYGERGMLVRLSGIADRTMARRLIGADIAVDEDQLPPLPDGEFYWSQLVGLTVINQQGEVLGKVHSLLATGAHDVLDVHGNESRHLIPFVRSVYVKAVDLEAGRLLVDWQREWS